MELTKFTKNVSNHQFLPDKPALTASELKELFDKAPEDIKDYLNDSLLPELNEALEDCLKPEDVVNDFNRRGN